MARFAAADAARASRVDGPAHHCPRRRRNPSINRSNAAACSRPVSAGVSLAAHAAAASVTAPSNRRARGRTGLGIDQPLCHGDGQRLRNRLAEMPLIDFPPARPAQHCRTVLQNDPAGGAVRAGLEIGLGAPRQGFEDVRLLTRLGCDRRGQLLVRLLEDGFEDRFLVWKMMVDRAFGDGRRGGDLVHRRGGKALRAEKLCRGRDDGGARALPPLCLRHHVPVSQIKFADRL